MSWAAEQRAGTLAVGDSRAVLEPAGGPSAQPAGPGDWRLGHLIGALRDKAAAAGITVTLVDARGTSSTCPACSRRVPKSAGQRSFRCPHCGHTGHRDLVAAANIAARNGGGTIPAPPGSGDHAPPSRDTPARRAPSPT